MQIIDGTSHIEEIKSLILEYASALGRDLSFQSLDTELHSLPSKYLPPNGRLFAALADDGVIAGCIAYHRHSDNRCEMKRLYVKPAYRKLRIGEALVSELIRAAKEDGYTEMVLDTIRPLKSAIHLYQKYGFQECGPYYHNPMADVIYMQLSLS